MSARMVLQEAQLIMDILKVVAALVISKQQQ